VNGTINPASIKEGRVCCIDDGVRVLAGDIARNNGDAVMPYHLHIIPECMNDAYMPFPSQRCIT
jgi:hypothetical protein